MTKNELVKLWKREPDEQYDTAITKIMQAINVSYHLYDGILICFSGGKDSCLLLETYAYVVSNILTNYKDKPIKVAFANTTNETTEMLKFVRGFIPYIENKYGVEIDFEEKRPPNNLTWAKFILKNGIPLISKMQSKHIRTVKNEMSILGVDYETVLKLAMPDMKNVNELFDIGFSKTAVLNLTGYISYKGEFGKQFIISKRWLPMLCCPIDITEQCCVKIKEAALSSIHSKAIMTGEQAKESKNREQAYLKSGCNSILANGEYKSKPFGPMTQQAIFWALNKNQTPLCADYGSLILDDKGTYHCTKSRRTGCALCGFGCQYDTERFIRLQETEPAKVNFAFKPKDKGGAGFKEAIEYMNEYCGTKVKIPII